MIIFYESKRDEELGFNPKEYEALLIDEDSEEVVEDKDLYLRQVVTLICLAATVALFSTKESLGQLAARQVY